MSFGPYSDNVLWSASRYGLPPAVLGGVLAQESGFNPAAVGDRGNSVGMGQFNTKGALKHFGLTRKQVLEMDPATQIDYTAKFLRYNVDRAKGNVWEGVRLYNGGGDPKYLEHVRGKIPPAQAQMLPSVSPKPVDVRTASVTPAAPPGDPRTGTMISPVTPAFGAQPPQAPAQPGQTTPGNFFRDPFIQMGLGILANPSGAGTSPLVGLARGAQQGLGAYNALQQQQIENELRAQQQAAYTRQTLVSQMNALGQNQPNPTDVARARQKMIYWQGPNGPQDTMVTVWDGMQGVHLAPNGQPVDPPAMGYAPTTSPGGGGGSERSRNPDNYTVDSWARYEQSGRADPTVLEFRDSKASKSGITPKEEQDLQFILRQTNDLLADFEENKSSFGTPGKWARTAHAVAGVLDTFIGGDDLKRLAKKTMGPDPTGVRNTMLSMVRRAATLFVDSGRLSDQDRDLAERLIGLGDQDWQGPEQVKASLEGLRGLVYRYAPGLDISELNVPSPGAVPPGAVPPGAVPPGAVPPGAVPPGAVPPGAVPPRVIRARRDASGKLVPVP